jgi:hydrogen peroxide-dependent heme synthase
MAASTQQTNVFVTYWLYRVEPDFRHLSPDDQLEAKAQFLSALESRPEDITLRGAYSLVGLRGDADLMLWVYGPNLDAIQRLAVALRQTGLGRYLETMQTYVGVVTPARYDPDHKPAFMLNPPPKRYVSVYPFVKTTEWYLLPYEQRRKLMAEHGEVGRHYAVPREKLSAGNAKAHIAGQPVGASGGRHAAVAPATVEEGGGVLSNTVDAFGLGDYEFILANESDDPAELCRMMESLRKVEVRRYTKQDVPIYLGQLKEPGEALADL